MYQNYQQQQQLPFSPEQVQTPYLNIGLNNPPYVPNYVGNPIVASYAPLIAASAAMLIQQESNRSPLRLFMYNQYSQNNFCNQDFDSLVVAILDYITFEMLTNRSNPEIIAQDAVPMLVGLLCAVNVKIFPELQRYTTPQFMQGINNDIMQFDMIARNIKGMQQNMGGMYPNQQQYGLPPRTGYTQPVQNQMPGRWNQSPVPTPMVGNTALFINQSRPVFEAAAPVTIGGSKYGNDSKVNPAFSTADPLKQPFAAREPNVIEASVANALREVTVSESGVDWKPTKADHYFPAYNPVHQVLYYMLDSDNNIVDINLKERTDPIMDYERHSLSTVFGSSPKELSFASIDTTLNNIRNGINEINAATELLNDSENDPSIDKNDPSIVTYVKKETIAETSLQVAWLIGALDRLQATDKIPDVYRAYARIAEPIVGEKDESDAIKNFGISKTFIELREKLDSSVNDISHELWGMANLKMTDLINRILKQNLSIPKLSIDSFVNDIQDLIEYLGNKYGTVIQDAFMKHQRDHIAATFQLMYEGIDDELTSDFMTDRSFVVAPKITYLASDYSLTHLNCTAFELEVELSKETAAVVTETYTPLMHALLDGLFKDVDTHTEHSYFDRHLIRTSDSRVLEATKGYVGENVYLLTLIK